MKKEFARKYSEFIRNNTWFHSWAEIYGGEWVVTVHGKSGLNVRYATVSLLKDSIYYDVACVNDRVSRMKGGE